MTTTTNRSKRRAAVELPPFVNPAFPPIASVRHLPPRSLRGRRALRPWRPLITPAEALLVAVVAAALGIAAGPTVWSAVPELGAVEVRR
jgi:hypothetical protein